MDTTDLLALSRIRAMARNGQALTIRVQSGITQMEMAEAIGCGRMTLRRWEEGESTPRNDQAALKWLELLDALEGAASGRVA